MIFLMTKPWKKLVRRAGLSCLLLFLLMNLMAFFHARKFTHFDPSVQERVDPSKVSFVRKLGYLFTGVSLPRPQHKQLPVRPYETIRLQGNVPLSCWLMRAQPARGTVVLCHGYGGECSDMLERAYVLLDAGYNVLLPDFMGAGGSGGNQCTIGFKEADNVKDCVGYLVQQGEKNIYLLGASMGAAAIMRACSREGRLPVKGLVLECPFGSMRQTVKNRFSTMGVPRWPLADMLVFWGGVQHGFNAFAHNPEDYALHITQPVLLLQGDKDERVRSFETDRIFRNLAGKKNLFIFAGAGHESYLNRYRQVWTQQVLSFLAQNP